jgi:hypothetical protein
MHLSDPILASCFNVIHVTESALLTEDLRYKGREKDAAVSHPDR